MKFKPLLASAAVALTPLAAAQASIKVGFRAELSGSQCALGEDQFDAFMMVDQANSGKLGGVAVEILTEDSQLNDAGFVRIRRGHSGQKAQYPGNRAYPAQG